MVTRSVGKGMAQASRPEDGWTWVSRLITGFYRSGPGYGCYRSHGTQDWLLTCTIGGCGRYGHALGDLLCFPGQVVLVKPGTRHDYGVENRKRQWVFYWVHFHPKTEWMELLRWPEESPGLMRLDLRGTPSRAKATRAMRTMHQWASGRQRHADAFAMNALEEVLLWCDLTNPRHAAPPDLRVRQAMEHGCRHLSDPLTLASLARACDLSPSRLSHLFLEQVGTTPMRWLEHQRLVRARDLLQVTGDPIRAIAEQVGFRDAFYFSTRFRRVVGSSPRAFRRESERRRPPMGSHD